jgi:hypothetical protein
MQLDEYRNLDVARWPQEVRLDFSRETVADEDPDTSYLEQDEFEDRLAAYRRGEFEFIGVRAMVAIWVPIGGTAFTRYELTSAGCWGIESDSDEAYLNEIFEDEKTQLVDAMKAIGKAAESLS